MALGRWTSLGLALIGAGCLVGTYGILSHTSAAAAGNTLSTPYLVVAQAHPAATGNSLHNRQRPSEGAADLPAETPTEVADDADGIEPRNMVGHEINVANSSPAEGWMRRLNIARELLRQGAEKSACQTFERIIGEAQVCRAYQYALVDLAAIELCRGRVESARQLLDEVRHSADDLPLDRITTDRVNALRSDLSIQTTAEGIAF